MRRRRLRCRPGSSAWRRGSRRGAGRGGRRAGPARTGERLISPPSSNCAAARARARPASPRATRGNAALHEQTCRNNAAPGGDAIETVGRLFGVRVEVPSPARERVEECGAITAVGARQDIGRIGRPEEDPLAPELRRPGLVDFGAVSDQPASDNCFRQPSAVFAGRRGRQVASQEKPCSARRAAPVPTACEVEVAKANILASDRELAGEQSAAPRGRSPATWSRGTATSFSGWRDALRRESSEPRASLRDDCRVSRRRGRARSFRP